MDLAGYLSVLRRRFPALLLCLVAGFGGGYYKGHHTASIYEATARSLVQQPNVGTVANQLTGAQLSSQFLATYAQIATSRSVAGKVVQALNLPTSAEGLQGQLSSALEPATYIIDIKAVDVDPARAQSLANTAAAALSERVAELERGKQDPVVAQLLDSAVLPTIPISPKPKSDQLLGLILGLVAGIVLIAALEALDRTIKTSAQGEAAFDSPLLALIPRSRSRGAAQRLSGNDTGAQGEPYRALRTAVQFTDPDITVRTILVTSASPGDGKTTTTSNLALALAASGERVVVVDADLRRATLAGVFGLEHAVGLSSLVLRTVELDDTLQEWAPGVTILPSGRPLPPNPSELLGSHFMSQLLDDLSARFDIVLIDTPPVLPVTDAVALATQVDAVLLVARHGKTQRGPAAEARRRLEAVGANVIGFVLNAVPARESAGYYADYRYEYTASRNRSLRDRLVRRA
jgi:capsular exopolysaccharide synthesis family protein